MITQIRRNSQLTSEQRRLVAYNTLRDSSEYLASIFNKASFKNIIVETVHTRDAERRFFNYQEGGSTNHYECSLCFIHQR